MKPAGETRLRLDVLLVERELVESRSRAAALILAGRVEVDGLPNPKPGSAVRRGTAVRVKRPEHPWVSRGGVKLAAGLDAFGIDPSGRICLDLGASTGGFTDVLLARGAARVYAVDVGWGQLHARLRADERVVLRERVNARTLSREQVPEPVLLAVADLAFISLRLVLAPLTSLLDSGAEAVLLVKPQFEAGRREVGRGGIVRDPAVRQKAVDSVLSEAAAVGLASTGVVVSPITGADGNVEFLAGFRFLPAKMGR